MACGNRFMGAPFLKSSSVFQPLLKPGERLVAVDVATAEDFRRIRTPMGLAIHSLTVEEIAISVLAELVAVRRGARNFVPLSVTNQLADKMLGKPPGEVE